MKCGRNKAMSVIRELADIKGDNLVARMRSQPFTVSTDGSNDAHSKQYPLVIRTYNTETKQVNSELLPVPICSGSASGENIFNLIDQTFKDNGIPWGNCLAIGSGNASVMTGHKKGVYAFAKAKNESIYSAGCTLHLVHIATRKAAQLALPPFDEVLTDIFYYFDKSDKRKSCFKGTQELYDVQQKRMLKHVCTRWLSIGNALGRMLHNWDALKVYFKEEHSKLKQKTHVRKSPACGTKEKEVSSSPADKVSPVSDGKGKEASSGSADKVSQSLDSKGKGTSTRPTDKVSLACGRKGKEVSSRTTDKVLPVSVSKEKLASSGSQDKQSVSAFSSYAEIKVDNIFTFMKSPTNKLYVLFMNYTIKAFNEFLIGMQAEEPKIYMLRRSIHKLIRQILVRFVKPSALVSKTVDQVQYKLKHNIKNSTDLVIGEEATAFIAASEENKLRNSRIEEFYENVKAYFTAVTDYLLTKLPLNDPVLCATEVADANLRMGAKQSQLTFLIERYPCLIPQGSSKDQVMEEFVAYQCYDLSDKIQPRLDDTWAEIAETVDEEGHFLFKNLASVMLGILTVPHSSAHCERIFSCVRKNRTDQRACLGDRSLEALLVVKSAQAIQTTAYNYSDHELDRLSSAYYKSLKKA